MPAIPFIASPRKLIWCQYKHKHEKVHRRIQRLHVWWHITTRHGASSMRSRTLNIAHPKVGHEAWQASPHHRLLQQQNQRVTGCQRVTSQITASVQYTVMTRCTPINLTHTKQSVSLGLAWIGQYSCIIRKYNYIRIVESSMRRHCNIHPQSLWFSVFDWQCGNNNNNNKVIIIITTIIALYSDSKDIWSTYDTARDKAVIIRFTSHADNVTDMFSENWD